MQKKYRKTLISTGTLLFFDFLKNGVTVPSKSEKQKSL